MTQEDARPSVHLNVHPIVPCFNNFLNNFLLTFLESSVPLTKTFNENGKSNYPINAYRFTSHTVTIHSIKEFHEHLIEHAAKGHCLLKGICHKPLNNESRKDSHKKEDPTRWLCIDIDGMELMSPEEFIRKILPAEFQNTSYIMQYSASMGIDRDRGLSGHLFFLLEHEIEAPIIKKWLTWLNLEVPEVRANISLTKNGKSLKYPIDITACQNDKLLFIAPPKCEGKIKDPLKLEDRYHLVIKDQPTVLLSQSLKTALKSSLDSNVTQKVMDLRKAKGITEKTKPKYKSMKDGEHILLNPDTAIVTGKIRENKKFVYLNINGGDSYGYYYIKDNPNYLYNFKGEPTVLLSEFVPDYWATIKPAHGGKVGSKTFLAFRERSEDTYYNGYFNEETQELDLHPVRSKDKIADFLASHGVAMPDPIHDWTYRFRPSDDRTVSIGDKFVNRFTPSKYLLEAKKVKPVVEMPSYIKRIIFHAVGTDIDCYNHFVNWLAYIYQYRKMTQTAWVLHGTEGTGKNAIVDKILQPTLGQDYVKVIGFKQYQEDYNFWMESCLVCLVDEARVSRKDSVILQKLRNQITAERNQIRRMRCNLYEVDMFINFIFSSNEIDVLRIPDGDRRFNVAVRQEIPFRDINNGSPLLDLKQINKELLAFTSFMMNYKVDIEKVKTPINNQAKQDMYDITEYSHEAFFKALREGDFEFFIQSFWEKPKRQNLAEFEDYKATIKLWIERGQKSRLSRDEIQTVYCFLQSEFNITANKFTSLMRHYGIKTKKMRIPEFDGPVYGVEINWSEDPANLKNFMDEKITKLPEKRK